MGSRCVGLPTFDAKSIVVSLTEKSRRRAHLLESISRAGD